MEDYHWQRDRRQGRRTASVRQQRAHDRCTIILLLGRQTCIFSVKRRSLAPAAGQLLPNRDMGLGFRDLGVLNPTLKPLNPRTLAQLDAGVEGLGWTVPAGSKVADCVKEYQSDVQILLLLLKWRRLTLRMQAGNTRVLSVSASSARWMATTLAQCGSAPSWYPRPQSLGHQLTALLRKRRQEALPPPAPVAQPVAAPAVEQGCTQVGSTCCVSRRTRTTAPAPTPACIGWGATMTGGSISKVLEVCSHPPPPPPV